MDKQKIQIIIGLIIITLLFTTITMYIQDKQRDEEIISSCGFTQKDWTCVCTQEALDNYNNQVNLSDIIQKDYKTTPEELSGWLNWMIEGYKGIKK